LVSGLKPTALFAPLKVTPARSPLRVGVQDGGGDGHRADAESGQTDFAVMRLDACNWGRK